MLYRLQKPPIFFIWEEYLDDFGGRKFETNKITDGKPQWSTA